MNKEDEGIDVQTFIFYDFVLRIFSKPAKTKQYFMDQDEFQVAINDFLFPNQIKFEMNKMPTNNITTASYQMFTYLNISNFNNEQDFLLKFIQTKEKKSFATNKKEGANSAVRESEAFTSHNRKQILELPNLSNFNYTNLGVRLFELIDSNSDNSLSFMDFGNFIQVLYLFGRFDSDCKGKLPAGILFDNFRKYSDFPRVTNVVRSRADRFNLLPQDLYVDAFTALTILRIDEIVPLYTRRVDKSTLYEIELKRIFVKMNLRFVPDDLLNHCVRGTDNKHIPKYDWECSFLRGIVSNLNYFESASFYVTSNKRNLNLYNTVFNNIDPLIMFNGTDPTTIKPVDDSLT